MKKLNLTLKKEWFDMILIGEKTEEYREIKDYWIKRLLDADGFHKKYDRVIFKNGYSATAPTIEIEFKGLSCGTAKSEWSGNWKGDVFIIKLGKIISTANCR